MKTAALDALSPGPGGKAPFEEVYDRYYFRVLRYVSARVSNRQDAEDLVGEVFLYCYEHYADYDSEKSAVGTWLYLVANSRLKNHYRDRREWVDMEEVEAFLSAESGELERAVWLDQLRGQLSEALAQLPERQRRAVVMRFFESRDFSEIAEALDTTEGNVRVILSRSLDRLEARCGALKEFL